MPYGSPNTSDQQPEQKSKKIDKDSKQAADRFQIFEAIALERLQTGSEATKPAAFLPLPAKLTAIAATGITAIGVLWSIFARVPVQVDGISAFVPSSGMGSLVAATSGQIYIQVSGLAPDVLPLKIQQQNLLISNFWRDETTSLTNQVNQGSSLEKLVEISLLPIQGQRLYLPEDISTPEVFDQPGRRAVVKYSTGTLLARILNPLANQELNSILLSTLPVIDQQQQQKIEGLKSSAKFRSLGKLHAENRVVTIRELQQRRELYDRKKQLWRQGFLPSTQLLEEQAIINRLESQLLNNDSSQVSVAINSQDQLTKSSQANINDIESRNKLENQLTHYLNKTATFVPEGGFYLLSRSWRNGSQVREGDELMTYSTSPPELPDIIPIFLNGPTSQQISDGMSVLVTPKGISRAESGGIPGKVVRVTKLPLPKEGVVGAVGSRTLAASIERQLPTPHLIYVKLEILEPNYCKQALSFRCYKWSSGRLPPHPVRLGTLGDVQITTIYRRPIEFVMPALRQALGLVVDNKAEK